MYKMLFFLFGFIKVKLNGKMDEAGFAGKTVLK